MATTRLDKNLIHKVVDSLIKFETKKSNENSNGKLKLVNETPRPILAEVYSI